jgi:hypothetical protein
VHEQIHHTFLNEKQQWNQHETDNQEPTGEQETGEETHCEDKQEGLAQDSQNLLGFPYPQETISSPIRSYSIQHQNKNDRKQKSHRRNHSHRIVNVPADPQGIINNVPECHAQGNRDEVGYHFTKNDESPETHRCPALFAGPNQLQIKG